MICLEHGEWQGFLRCPKCADANVEARVYRAFGERTFIEQDQNVGYDLDGDMFDNWWLQWFWCGETLDKVDYRVAGLSLLFMAAMVETGDA